MATCCSWHHSKCSPLTYAALQDMYGAVPIPEQLQEGRSFDFLRRCNSALWCRVRSLPDLTCVHVPAGTCNEQEHYFPKADSSWR